jgi:hypothetical protein
MHDLAGSLGWKRRGRVATMAPGSGAMMEMAVYRIVRSRRASSANTQNPASGWGQPGSNY